MLPYKDLRRLKNTRSKGLERNVEARLRKQPIDKPIGKYID